MSKLHKCPSCKSIPVVLSNDGKYKVKCKCGVETKQHLHGMDAVTAWNLRCASILNIDGIV